VMGWVPRGVRPIEAITVARALRDAALHARPGVKVLASGEMQVMGRAPAA